MMASKDLVEPEPDFTPLVFFCNLYFSLYRFIIPCTYSGSMQGYSKKIEKIEHFFPSNMRVH